MPAKKTSMEEKVIRLDGTPFGLGSKQVIFYDPNPSSAFSAYIKTHLTEIKEWFGELDMELCYIPDICRHFTEEEIRYLVPNWNGEPLNALGNDFLKTRLNGKYANIGAGFIRKNTSNLLLYNFFPLAPMDELSWDGQMRFYKSLLLESYNSLSQCAESEIRFSIAEPDEGGMYPLYEKKLSRADGNFSEDAISAEVRWMVEQLHKEGLFFKNLVDYRDELRSIYAKITNRTSTDVIDDSLDKVTDPTDNAINEKCSRIREAFIKHIDKSLAKSYCITGWRSERKRITLPRKLVEWQCELPF